MEKAKVIFFLGVLFALSPWSNSALALFAGILIALTFGNPYQSVTSRLSQKLLMYSVIGLGAGMNLMTVASAGMNGIGYTAISILLTLGSGVLIGRWLKTDFETSWLVSFGTAICGGSAIAALAPVIKAKPQSISVSLGVVFLLNSVALIVFPAIGHQLNLSEEQFGFWSALAIHDTSSVVGASLQYGAKALQIGTTVKLARALWIVPATFLIGFILAKKEMGEDKKLKVKKPWFILGFLVFAAVFTWVPALSEVGQQINGLARKTLVLTLFLIGSNLSLNSLRAVGLRPLLQGVLLWLLVATTTLVFIYNSFLSYNQ